MVYRPLYCPCVNDNGHVCNAHLADIESDVQIVVVVRCRQAHLGDGKKRVLQFTQHVNGTIAHRVMPENEERVYAPDTIRYHG